MIFIAGATGFVGGQLIGHLLSDGFQIKCLLRSQKAGEDLSAKGVTVIPGDITRPETLKGAIDKDDFVVHLVGIIEEKGKATFQEIHVEGTAHLVEEAKRAGVRHFFYQSALGSDKDSWSGYLKTKAEAEEIVRGSGLSHTIFRPSLIIGPWDGFTKKIVEMLRLSPVLPIPGEGKALFQPVYIKDWVRCMRKVIDDPAAYGGIYEIGGPEHLAYREIVRTISRAMGQRKPSFSIPMGLMKLSTSILETLLPSPPVTSDQLRLLEQNNITDINTIEKHFGFSPIRLEEALREFFP